MAIAGVEVAPCCVYMRDSSMETQAWKHQHVACCSYIICFEVHIPRQTAKKMALPSHGRGDGAGPDTTRGRTAASLVHQCDCHSQGSGKIERLYGPELERIQIIIQRAPCTSVCKLYIQLQVVPRLYAHTQYIEGVFYCRCTQSNEIACSIMISLSDVFKLTDIGWYL